jgi:hypothetical protein
MFHNLFNETFSEKDEYPFKSLDLPKYYFDTFLEERTPNVISEAQKIHKVLYPGGPRVSKTILPLENLSISERMLHIESEIKKHFTYEK